MKVDLTGKVAVVTGGGGILCSVMAEALAKSGAKVAILDLREENAKKVADKINAEGGKAIGLAANVLELESLQKANEIIKAELGICDILINGAGGNNPKGTTSKEYLTKEDLAQKVEGLTTFFDLDPAGVGFVFNLNFLGTLLPTQVFARDMAAGNGGAIINISSMNAYCPLTKIPAYSGAKAAISNFTQWLAVHFSKVGIRVNATQGGLAAAYTAFRYNISSLSEGQVIITDVISFGKSGSCITVSNLVKIIIRKLLERGYRKSAGSDILNR